MEQENYEKKSGKWQRTALKAGCGALALVIALGVGIWLGRETVPQTTEQKKLADLQSMIEKNYLFDTTQSEQTEGLYAGLISSLNDPYSEYYTEKKFQQFVDQSSGSYAGVGAVVSQDSRTGKLSFESVFNGGPAEEAGIQAGDRLTAVDGISTDGLALEDVIAEHVLGEAGTVVVLSIQRAGTEDVLEVPMTRQIVEIQSVRYALMPETAGYIQVTEFDTNTTEQFCNAVDQLQTQGADRIIIDLRENPGGDLDAALAMADYLLPDDIAENSRCLERTSLVYLKDKKGNRNSYFAADGHEVKLPISILLNQNSASASELFSAALWENGQAVLVGTQSYGKGIVQSLFDLEDGTGIKLTTSQYFTPSGYALHKKGLKPDVSVPLSDEEFGMVQEKNLLEIPEKLAGDKQYEAALHTVDEVAAGSRILSVKDGQDNDITPPEDFMEQAKENECHAPHFSLNIEQVQSLLEPQLAAVYNQNDSWNSGSDVSDGTAKLEWEVSWKQSSGDMQFTFGTDPTDRRVHWFELYDQPEQAAQTALSLLKESDALTAKEEEALRTKLTALSDGEKEYTYTGKQFTLTAWQENGLLTIDVLAK